MTEVTFKPNDILLNAPKDQIELWAKALESGEYQQGQSMLCMIDEFGHNKHSFCCLGVWQAINGTDVEYMGTGFFNNNDPHFVPFSNIPDLANANVATYIDEERDEEIQVSFMHLNDHYALTFSEIAQLLRGNEVTTERRD